MRCSVSLATAYATQPQETQPRLEPKNQCVHSVVSSTFFPLLEKKKKKLLQNQASPPLPTKQSWNGPRAKAETLSGTAAAGGGWPPRVERREGGSYTASRRETTGCTNGSHSTADVLCCHFRKKENPEQIWRGFHHTVIAVLLKDVTVSPPTE